MQETKVVHKKKVIAPKLRFKGFKDIWKNLELKDLSKIYDGTHQTPTYVKEGIPFYSVEHITANQFLETKFISQDVFDKENKRVSLEKGDILMTRIGDIGTARLIDWDVRASFYVSLALLKQTKAISSPYLNQYIASKYFQAELWKRIIHVAFPKKINLGEIGNCHVKLPSLPEQQKIASFLSAVDEKIQLLKHKKQLLEQYKKGVMQQLFSGKLRFKDGNGKAYPKWEEKLLGKLIEIGSSKRVLQEDWKDEGVPFLRTREIINLSNGDDFRTPIFISEDLFSELKKKYGVPKSGDILATGVGTIGELYIVKKSDKFYFKDGNVIWFKMNDKLDSNYLSQLFKIKYIKKQLIDNASITTVATFTIDGAKKTRIIYPCLEEQKKIANFLSAIDAKIESLSKQISQTQNFKKGLLQQMFV